MNTPLFRKLNLEAYKPGRSFLNKKKSIIKLSANESALGMSKNANKAIIKSKNNISKYPDGKFKELTSTISKKYNCKQNQIICGSGSDEIIQMLCQLFLNKGDEVVVPEYSFLMYRIYAKIVGAKVIFSKEKNFKVSNDEIIKKITKRTKIVFIANPNNPTGTMISYEDLKNLHKKLPPNILLVIDEAYIEYVNDNNYSSFISLVENNNNIVVTRTFSKAYGLAGLRVGWAYCPSEVINVLGRLRIPFSVNSTAQKVAVAAIDDQKHILKSIDHNNLWLPKITEELENIGFQTIPSSCNKICN